MISPEIPFQTSRSFVSTCSNSVHDYLLQKNPSVEDILINDSCFRSFRSGNIEISKFFIKNVSSIFEIALKDNNSIITSRAFSLFSLENRSLIDGLLQTDDLQQMAEQLLSGDPSLLVLSKYSSILSNCFNIFPSESIKKCRFLEMFFPFCSYHPVLNLFAQIVRIRGIESQVIEFLSDIKIVDHLLDYIDSMEDETEDIPDIYIGYFLLVFIFSTRDEICQYLKQPENLVKITKHFNIMNLYLNNAQWSSILNLTDESTLPYISSLIPVAVMRISSATANFHRYHIFCIDFLEKCLNISDGTEIIDSYLSFGICQIIKNVFVKFPNNSNAHIHLSRLLKTMLTREELSEYVLDEIIPFACEFIINRDNIILSAFSWNLIKMFEETLESSFVLSLVPEDVIDQMNNINNLLDNEYGGPAPKADAPETNVLPQITPEQLLMIFKKFR